MKNSQKSSLSEIIDNFSPFPLHNGIRTAASKALLKVPEQGEGFFASGLDSAVEFKHKLSKNDLNNLEEGLF